MKNSFFPVLVSCLLFTACSSQQTPSAEKPGDTPELQALGRAIYFDTNLSEPAGQSCASCHTPGSAFTDPDQGQATSEGVITGRFGSRNAPTVSYAAFIPSFRFVPDGGAGDFLGGQFWDGRASTLEEQAKAPFLNILEMNNPDKNSVVGKVSVATYANDFKNVFGANAFNNVDSAYDQIAIAIAAFERTSEVSPFTSKFDDVQRGLAFFTAAELNGSLLFIGKAQCARCHNSPNGAQVFSNFIYHNIGVPKNPANPFLLLDPTLNPDGAAFVDLGLGGVLADSTRDGEFRVPTLRNIALTAPYMHNGVFNTLEEVINFYNRRDLDSIVPEVNLNVNNELEIGELGLTAGEIQDLIAFLNTFSDN